MSGLPRPADPNLLVGYDSSDDAAVYKVSPDLAVIQTVDFFPPVVDDPYTFGQIAAANALSDVYAMGGKPTLAMNLLAFPSCLPVEAVGEILAGGASKVAEAGAVIAGGHSIEDQEPKYGLCVTGLVHPRRILTNSGAKVGDILVLTKALGTGLKQGLGSFSVRLDQNGATLVQNISPLPFRLEEYVLPGCRACLCTLEPRTPLLEVALPLVNT